MTRADDLRHRRGNVGLRDVEKADLPILFEQQLDADAVRMAAFPSRDREAFEAHWAQVLADETVIKKTVLLDGRVAGYVVGFERDSERLVGYWIGKEFWGKGVATRALSEFKKFLDRRPVFARVATHNVASIRVLEKCGFVLSGVEKDPDDVEELVMRLDG